MRGSLVSCVKLKMAIAAAMQIAIGVVRIWLAVMLWSNKNSSSRPFPKLSYIKRNF